MTNSNRILRRSMGVPPMIGRSRCSPHKLNRPAQATIENTLRGAPGIGFQPIIDGTPMPRSLTPAC